MFRILFVVFAVISFNGLAQNRFTSEKSFVSFFSKGVIEDIKATNITTTSIFDASTGDIAYLLNSRDFQFEKKLMQVHFNEKYMETEKFPKSSFEGKVIGFNPDLMEEQAVKAVGKLTIHGVTNDVEVPGAIQVVDNGISMRSTFVVRLQDYNIKVPQIIWQNIAQEVEVTIEFLYRPVTN